MDVDVAVIGGGVMGAAAAWRLARAGVDVMLLEQHAIGHDRGSSHGPTRIFRIAYPDPFYVECAQRARALWRALDNDLVHTSGGLDIGSDEQIEAIERALSACGATSERIDARSRASRFPWFAGNAVEAALWSPDTGVIAAAKSVATMIAAARASGATIWDECPAVIENVGEAVELGSARGTVRARRCVVAAGGWAAPLLGAVGIEVPLTVTQEQVFYFRARSRDVDPFIHHGAPARYAVPARAGAPGIKVAEHKSGRITRADERSFDVDPDAEARVVDYVRSTLPTLDPTPVAAETCLYTMTPDEDFVIDARGRVIVCSPCSGHGFKFAPLVGEIVACLASDRPTPVDIARFGLDRFPSSR